jgi:ketosteroid isomerase-like protein
MLRPMSTANEQLIERFYAVFDARDGDAMAACYAPGAHFSDPVFPDLNGTEPGAMWRMLTSQANELRIELLEHEADDTRGSARWRAHYVFSQTGRPVVNDVRAEYRFADGLIAEHTDQFSFHRWSRQALGAPGLLLGWTPVLKATVRRKAAANLASFTQRDGHSSSA